MIHYLDGVSNFDGDLVSTEYVTTSGSVAGGLNPTTITSGAPMDPIIVPRGEDLQSEVFVHREVWCESQVSVICRRLPAVGKP